MAVADVLNVDPFDLEMTLELTVLVLPPKGESLVEVLAGKPSHSLEVPALHR